VADQNESDALSASESWAYIDRFLRWLVICFAGVTVLLTAYNMVLSSSTEEGRSALADPADGAALIQAFEALKSPHLFGGWRVPKNILKGKQYDEEALAGAANAAPSFPAPAGSLRNCKKDLLCAVRAFGVIPKGAKRPPYNVQIYRYLKLRRAMLEGRELSDGQLKFFKRRLTLWVRAFDRQIASGKGKVTASDAAMLGLLLESREVSQQNTLFFCVYGAMASLMMGLFLFLWRRRKPAEEPAA
jgi:hypothetical protein